MVEAVHEMVPVIESIEIGPDVLEAGNVYPGIAIPLSSLGFPKYQFSESPSASNGSGLYCQGVFTGRCTTGLTIKYGVELESTVSLVRVVNNCMLLFNGLGRF